MTIRHWMLLGATLAGGLFAGPLAGQDPTPVPADPPPPPLIPASEPAPVTAPAPAVKPDKKPASKSAAKKPAARPAARTSSTSRPAADLKPGPAVAMSPNVNVRGQAAINSEVVTHLKRGDLVTVLEQITLKKPGTDEPGKWARISLPAGSVVWAHASFIDADSKAVKPNRLNVRSGPGENYSILGRINKGTVVHELERKGDWMKIEAPTNAYAFAAAHLLTQEPAQIAAALSRNAPAVTTAVVKEKPVETVAVQTQPVVVAAPEPIAPPPQAPANPPVTPGTAPADGTPPAVAPEPPPPSVTPPSSPVAEAEPLIKRIVTREGIVRGSASIQAPTYLVLRSLDNNRTINYLHSVDTNIVLRAFQHQRVIVVGEEILDERWPNTPVIDVESIETVP